jgi:hypothetical protein
MKQWMPFFNNLCPNLYGGSYSRILIFWVPDQNLRIYVHYILGIVASLNFEKTCIDSILSHEGIVIALLN